MLIKHMIEDHGLTEDDIARIAHEQYSEEEVLPKSKKEKSQDRSSRNLWGWIMGKRWIASGGLTGPAPIAGCVVYDTNDTTQCDTCNSQSVLMNGTCQCTFDYYLQILQQGLTYQIVVDDHLDFTSDVAQDGSLFDCSSILSLTISSAANITDDGSGL
jgi:hypothetical protein